MSHLLPAGPDDTRYHTTVHVDPSALDAVLRDRTFRRERLAGPLARVLIDAGYQVPDWRVPLAAASVTAAEAADGRIAVTATTPRPWVVPAGELNPESTITVEYVGGEDDGRVEPHHMDPVVPPNLAIALNGSVYLRTAYHLVEGVWLYQKERSRPQGPAEVEDDDVWDADQP